MEINASAVKYVETQDFVENKNYKIVLFPEDLVPKGFWGFKKEPYGSYSISEVAYDGWIHYDESYINKIGLVIHDRKVCYPPRLIINWLDGSKTTVICDSFEEAKTKRDEILSKMNNVITI